MFINNDRQVLIVSVYCSFLLFAGRCKPLTISLCSSMHYNMTLFPNFFNQTQGEASAEIGQFLPLVHYGCSSELPLLLCSLYAPPCSEPRLPCRELCNRVKNGCLPVLTEFGIPWPTNMPCDNFPSAKRGTKCIVA